MVTVDLVVFALLQGALHVLLVRRRHDPFAGQWAIPGGYLEMNETAEAGARRELREETGLDVPCAIEPIGFFARPDRDPRGRTITLAYAAVLPPGEYLVQGSDDAVGAEWLPLKTRIDLAFDHGEILANAIAWVKRGVLARSRALAFQLLPETFDRDHLQALMEDLGLPRWHADTWLGRMAQSGRVEALDPQASHFRQVPPGRPGRS